MTEEEKELHLKFEVVLSQLRSATADDVESVLEKLWQCTSAVNSYYRDKFQVGYGWHMSEAEQAAARKAWDMVGQGKRKEILKELKLKPAQLQNLMAKYKIYMENMEKLKRKKNT